MSKLSFVKYQGAGNDFLLIDDRAFSFGKNPQLIRKLCHRRFGVGADGIILLQLDASADFRMQIFNSDGSEAESCGNGLRCLVRFTADLGLWQKDGCIATKGGLIRAGMRGERIWTDMGLAKDAKQLLIDPWEVHCLNTGVPHAVVFSDEADLRTMGPFLRSHPLFQPAGTNVNLASIQGGEIHLSTYERGVEGETLACGTGAAATAIIAAREYGLPNPIQIRCKGGTLEVLVKGLHSTIFGEALKVFEGYAYL